MEAVTPQLLQHLAQLGRRYDAQALKRFAPPKRHALVAAFLVEARRALLDQVVTMHDQYMTGFDRRSRFAFEDKHRRLRRRARAGIDTLLATLDILLDADREAPISSLYKKLSEEELREAATDCRAFARLEGRGFVEELAARYGDLRKYLPAFHALPFEAAAGSETLLAAVEVARKLDAGASEKLLDDAPRHSLARWLFFANRGEFRVGDYEEMMNKASCLGLLSNAAVLWNTVQIERVVGRLRAGGAEIDPADLVHAWPLQHARIIPNGTCFLDWPHGEMAETVPA